MEFTAQNIAEFLKGSVEGNPEAKVSNISKIEEGKPGTLSFLANPKYSKYLYTTEASVVLVNKDLELEQDVKATLVRVEDAYKSFASLLELYVSNLPQKKGVAKQVSISESASYGEGCYIGDFAVIGDGVKIGNNVKIYPQVYLGDGVVIEDNTTLYAGVKVYDQCKIGSNCIIHSGTVIGSDGFGFAPTDGINKKIPQIGNVVIEDDVEIGSNVSIDRATMGSTIIRRGVKLDNLIQIAHNVEIGENCMFASQVGIAGSTKIGKSCIFGGQVGVVGHLTIADEVKIASQSGVSNSLKKEGEVVLGSPAINIRDSRRSLVLTKRLPELYDQIRELEKQVKSLVENNQTN